MPKYVEIYESTFLIPADSAPSALEAIKQLNKDTPDSYKRGGDGTFSWFSWMPTQWNHFKTLRQFLRRSRFLTKLMKNGDIRIFGYRFYRGQEAVYIVELARYVKEGCYIVWVDDMGNWLWKWVVERDDWDDKKVFQYVWSKAKNNWVKQGDLDKINKAEMTALNAIKVKLGRDNLEGLEEIVSA